jgi:translation initiation factor IF-1
VSSEDRITLEGRVVEQLQERLFRAELANGHRVLVHPTRATRSLAVQVRIGSRVRLELSPFDMSTARMVAMIEGEPNRACDARAAAAAASNE